MSTDKGTLVSLEYLDHLSFGATEFVYKGNVFPYKNVTSIQYSAIVTKHRVNFVPAGSTYDVHLCLRLLDGTTLRVKPERAFLGIRSKERHNAVMQAASVLMKLTFDYRLARYESQLRSRHFIEWGHIQLHRNGDLFRKHHLRFNVKDPGISSNLSVFSAKFYRLPKNALERLKGVFHSDHEEIDLTIDRDCFLYFMKHCFGITWRGIPVPEKTRTPRQIFNEALITLAGKIAAADLISTDQELSVFKELFGIDEFESPDLDARFYDAARNQVPIRETARTIFESLAGKREALEFVLAGLVKIAAIDGIHDAERFQVYEVGRTFRFTALEIDQIITIFSQPNHESSNAKSEEAKQSGKDDLAYHLKVLGLDTNATIDDIKKAYRSLVKRHHPDLLQAQGVAPDRVKAASILLAAVNSSFEWLERHHRN